MCFLYEILLSYFLIPVHSLAGNLGLGIVQAIIEGFDDIVTSFLIC